MFVFCVLWTCDPNYFTGTTTLRKDTLGSDSAMYPKHAILEATSGTKVMYSAEKHNVAGKHELR
jgi:hypothetical protein